MEMMEPTHTGPSLACENKVRGGIAHLIFNVYKKISNKL
jgi:hypothetical protein